MGIQELFDRVEHYSKKNNLITSGDRVMICISGGADSVCLVRYFLSVKDRYNLTLSCCHLNHQLRQNADNEEMFVREFCREWGIPLIVRKSDVRQFASENRLSVETAAREVRYGFFKECAQKFNADRTAVAHNLTDSIETFMMNAYRGSGIRGLKGIAPQKGAIIRPLLCATSSEIRHCMNQADIECVEDESNKSSEYQRNRVRHSVIPSLYKAFEVDPEKGFERTMVHNQSTTHAIQFFIDHFLQQHSEQMESVLRIKKEVFTGNSKDVLFETLLRIFERLTGSTYYATEIQMENLIRFCSKGESGYVQPFEKMDFHVVRSLSTIYFFSEFKDVSVELTGKDEQDIHIFPGVYCQVKKVISPGPCTDHYRFLVREKEFPLLFEAINFDHDTFCFSGRKISNLKQFLKKRGVGQFERNHFPVLKKGNDILWIPGVACSEKHRETVFSGPFIEVYIKDLLG